MSRHSRGQIAIILALAIPTLIAGLALCTDVAVMYVNWALLQRAADASALAGANYLPFDSSKAQSVSTDYVTSNSVLAAEIVGTPTVSADQLSITVTLSRTVPYFLARAVELTSGTVQAAATAGIMQNGANGRGLMPVALECIAGNCGYAVNDFVAMRDDKTGPGNWAALALGSHGASPYQSNLEAGYLGVVVSPVNPEQGSMAGPTMQGIADRIAVGVAVDSTIAAGANPPSPPPVYDPRLVVVPIIDPSTCSGGNCNGNSSPVAIVGYAQMWLLDSHKNKSATVIDAVYLGTTTLPSGDSSTQAFGLTTPVLLR
jgi:Putative Flp pilus-assembly TadE/G-like